MSLTYEGPAVVDSVNIRKEGEEGNKVLAVDVEFRISIDSGFMAYFADDLAHYLWNAEGKPRYPQIKEHKWSGVVSNMEIELMGLAANGVDLDKFVIELLPSRKAVLTFRAKWKPQGRDVAIVAESLVAQECDITLTPMPGLDFDKEPTSRLHRQVKKQLEAAQQGFGV
jgi:hypothetical protein